jgi:hypothetical protein
MCYEIGRGRELALGNKERNGMRLKNREKEGALRQCARK